MNDVLFSLNFIVLHWAVIFDMLNMTAAMIKITKTI